METKDTHTELDILRQQMDVLKKKLDTQEIINVALIKESMKNKMSWIKKYVFLQMGLIPVIAIMWVVVVYAMHISWWSYIFLLAMCCIDVAYDYHINVRAITDEDYNRSNLIEMTKKLMKMKRQRAIQMTITIPLLILFLLWVGYEAYSSIDIARNAFETGFIKGGLFGGAIGGILGIGFAIRIFLKMQKTNDEVIKQIEEMREG